MQRREFLTNAAMLASGAAIGLPGIGSAADSVAVPARRGYSYHGRPDDYTEFRVIDPGRVIQKIETFNQGMFAIVRILEDQGYNHYEEPCPYWELEWTAEVAAMPNAGPLMEWSIEPGGMNKQATGLLGPNPFVRDGRAHFEAGPGWGVKINPEWLKSATYEKSERKA